MGMPVVQIQARLGSTRLPGKILYSLAGRRIVRRVLDSALTANEPETVVFAIGDRPENDAVVEWCERAEVPYHQGPEDDLLARHLGTAEAFDAGPVVRVTGDCPFIPPGEIDRIVREHGENTARYTTNFAEGMPIGTAVDAIDRDVLSDLRKRGDTHPVRRLREHPEEWDVAVSPAERWTELAPAHTAVDTPEDYWTLTDAVTAVGEDPQAVTEWVAEHAKSSK
jgi:spore coat polysaccharide biosynthesis protein SpsF